MAAAAAAPHQPPPGTPAQPRRRAPAPGCTPVKPGTGASGTALADQLTRNLVQGIPASPEHRLLHHEEPDSLLSALPAQVSAQQQPQQLPPFTRPQIQTRPASCTPTWPRRFPPLIPRDAPPSPPRPGQCGGRAGGRGCAPQRASARPSRPLCRAGRAPCRTGSGSAAGGARLRIPFRQGVCAGQGCRSSAPRRNR